MTEKGRFWLKAQKHLLFAPVQGRIQMRSLSPLPFEARRS